MDWLHSAFEQINQVTLVMTVINAMVHIVFAAAVAKDAGKLMNQGQTIRMVSGMSWAFATLAGGVWIACAYWAMHHVQFPQR